MRLELPKDVTGDRPLRHMRILAKLSQKELAYRMGFIPSMVSRWEADPKRRSLEEVGLWAKACGFTATLDYTPDTP